MKRLWTIVILTLLLGNVGQAQTEHSTILQRTWNYSGALDNDVFTLAYQNPAMKFSWHSTTLNQLQVGGVYHKENLPTIIQEGDGSKLGIINIESFIKKDKNTLWGQAYYHNGKKTGRNWNETSDYSLLYPYVMGDTIGGDLKSEQYYFSGGYAHQYQEYVFGIEGSYHACIEYRHADPRPKNLTGDLKVRLGGARNMGKHQMGAAFYARKYKQTNDLTFYNELGVPNIYHFTGLGTDYYRYRGAKGESFYKGRAFGASIDLVPTQGTGISAAVHYTNFQFDKFISSLNELPMASVNEHKVALESGWKSTTDKFNHWGLTGNFSYTKRFGTENIFGTPSGNNFPKVGAEEKYMNRMYSGDIKGIYERSQNHWRWGLMPYISFSDIKTLHAYPNNEMNLTMLNTGTKISGQHLCEHWLFSANAGIDYRFTPKSDLQLAAIDKTEEAALYLPLLENYQALRNDRITADISFRADYSWKKNYALFFSIKYIYGKDQRPSTSHFIAGQLGITF